MKTPRSWHAACFLEKKIFVFGGWFEGALLDSIEWLDTSLKGEERNWVPTQVSAFTRRMLPAVVSIGKSQIAIMGGSCNKDIIIYEPEKSSATVVACAKTGFNCYSEPRVDRITGDVYALVSSGGHKIIKFSQANNNEVSFL